MADLGNKSIKDVFMESGIELKLGVISEQLKKLEHGQEKLEHGQDEIKETIKLISERVTKLETREEFRELKSDSQPSALKDFRVWLAGIAILLGVGNTGAQIIPESGGKNQDTEILREIFMKYLNIPKPPVSGYYPQAYPIDPVPERSPKKP